MGRPDGKWAPPDRLLKTRGNAFLTLAVRTGVVAVRTVLGQHRFLSLLVRRIRTGMQTRLQTRLSSFLASGQTMNGLRMISERCSRVLVLEFLTASRPDDYESSPDACTGLALFFPFCSRTLANTSN
jgi:hypothetical protein